MSSASQQDLGQYSSAVRQNGLRLNSNEPAEFGANAYSSSESGFGYRVAVSGNTVQQSNRSTAVTVNHIAGVITTNNASLAAEAAATFTVSCSSCAIDDVVIVCIQGGSNGGNTAATVTAVASGSFNITVSNNNASGGTAETGAILLNYFIFKTAVS